MKDPYKQWNRCDFCGRFIGFKDFDEGRAKRIYYFDQASSWDPMPEEKYDTYHVECYEKEAAVEEDRKEREYITKEEYEIIMEQHKAMNDELLRRDRDKNDLAAMLERLNTNGDRWAWEPMGGLYLVPKEDRPGEGYDTPLAAVQAALEEVEKTRIDPAIYCPECGGVDAHRPGCGFTKGKD